MKNTFYWGGRSGIIKSSQRGFSLIELTIAMMIVAIMVVWGMPSLMHVMESQRSRSAVSEFRSAMSVARYESYGQGRRMVIAKNCAVNGGGSTCTDKNWSNGFQVFICRAAGATSTGDMAEKALSTSVDDCLNPKSGSTRSGKTPMDINATKQSFEGFHRRVRICDRLSSTAFHSANALLFNPNGTVYMDNVLAASTPTEIRSIDFYFYTERGDDDIIDLISVSADGHTNTRRVNGVNIDRTMAATQCEPE